MRLCSMAQAVLLPCKPDRKKHPRFRGLNLITYLDDASKCAVAARLFREAASENTVRP